MIESRHSRTARFPLVSFIERRSRRQRIAVGVLVGVAALLWGATRLAGVILDRWWLDSVTEAPVWSTVRWAQVQLGVVTGVASVAVLGGSARFALRTNPVDEARPTGVRARYRGRMGPAHGWLVVAVVAWASFTMVKGATGQWQQWLLFRHGGSIGESVPELGHDLGYYLFDLPFLATVSSWLRTLVALSIGLVAFIHAASGAVRIPGGDRRSAPRALTQITALVVGFAVLQALHYVVVARPMLAVDRSGSFDGAGFVQDRVVAPGLWLLTITACAAAALVVLGWRRRSWKLPVAALAGWGLLHLVVLLIVPAVVQRVVVAPAEADRELAYINHNLDATIDAYGLDRVAQRTEVLSDGLDGIPDASALAALARVPVFSTDPLAPALQVLQGTTATRIDDVDVDRYELDGIVRPIMVAARNASRGDLPEQGWVQQHLVFTHGDGVVAVPADAPDLDGRPDPNAAADLVPERDELYFGEGLDNWYAIVGTDRRELGGSEFDADTGISIGSTWRRLVTAAAVGEIEPLVSSEIGDDAQLLYRRGLRERVHSLAPFLALDSDPYPVLVDDGVVWVIDAYTTASTYPYAQFADGTGLPARGDLDGARTNYIHGSVRVTVDAYDGSVHLYRTGIGEADPILATWEKILPDLIEPLDAMPADLRSHLRYPTDLFTVQTSLLGRYHVDDPETLFDGSQRWSISASAGTAVGESAKGSSPSVSMFLASGDPAGADTAGWVAQRTYSPGSGAGARSARDEMVAYAIGDHDDPERLELVSVIPAAGRQLSSPQVAQSAIDADPELAELFTLLNANGSKVQFGPMTLVPVGDGIVWVRPIIVTGTAATTAPRVYGVVAVSNGIVGQGPDTESAVRAALAAT